MQNLASPDQVLLELLHDELVKYYSTRIGGQLEYMTMTLIDLQFIGFKIGFQLLERLTGNGLRYIGEMGAFEFICTHMWNCLFAKHADCLETNCKGKYVISDYSFRYLNKIANDLQLQDTESAEASTESAELAPLYLGFTTGLIRGILSDLEIFTDIVGEVDVVPGCKFHITVKDVTPDEELRLDLNFPDE